MPSHLPEVRWEAAAVAPDFFFFLRICNSLDLCDVICDVYVICDVIFLEFVMYFFDNLLCESYDL